MTYEQKLNNEAFKLAKKAKGLPDEYEYKASNGEIWLVNDKEDEFLNDSDKENTLTKTQREEVVTKIGSGKIDSQGRRRMFVITAGVLLAGAAIGAVAKGVTGYLSRRKQRKALEKSQASIDKLVDKAEYREKEGYRTVASETQDARKYAELQKTSEFESFAEGVNASIKTEGEYVKGQKGLKTGAGAKAEETAMTAAGEAATMKDKMSVMAQANMDKATKDSYSSIKTKTDDIITNLKAGKQNIQQQIDATKGIHHYIDDGLEGAAMGAKFVTTFGTPAP